MISQEKECSNLELSKKLKELGVLQESKFYWFKNYFPDGYLEKGEWELVLGKPLFQKDETAVCDNDCYSAYTIGELGEMLPEETVSYTKHCLGYKYQCHYEVFNPVLDDMLEYKHYTYAETEADARAEMLIYLIENNYITVEEVNNKLKS